MERLNVPFSGSAQEALEFLAMLVVNLTPASMGGPLDIVDAEAVRRYIVGGKSLHMVMPEGHDVVLHAWVDHPGVLTVDTESYVGGPSLDLVLSGLATT
jgi:hypothetical protein